MAQEKQAEIAQQCREAVKGSTFVLFRGHYRELPVIEVPLALPLYRPENGRIISQLQQRLEEKALDAERFRREVEEPWVQQELHKLLLALAQDERGPIYRELEQQAQQTESLLITRAGVVVNGNRRLAAMRDLHAQAPASYAGFARLRVAVLPEETTSADIEYVESALQLAPETKLAYTWTNRRLKLRRQRLELALPLESILESYRLPDKQAMEVELEELALAEAYLRDYCQAAHDYERIEDAEALFVALNQALRSLDEELAETWRWAGFAMIHARQRSKVKLLNYFPFADPRPAYAPREALVSLAQAEELLSQQATQLDETARQRLVDVLRDPEAAERLSRELADILDQLRIDANRREAPKKLLQHVQQARKFAEKLEAGRLSSQQKAELGSELAAIQYHSRRFLEDKEDAPAPLSPTRRKWRKLREDPYRYCAESTNPMLRRLARHWPGR